MSRPSQPSPFRIGPAIGTWVVAWLAGSLVLVPLVVLALGADLGDDLDVPAMSAGTAASWVVFLVALAIASRRFGTGDPVHDLALGFRPIDLLGAPLGVLAQVAIVPLLYVPLREWWPDTFSSEELEERARDLADRAEGWEVVLLVLVVAVGAPIVEELVYRGLLQRSFTSFLAPGPGLVLAALWFMAVHSSPVEFPGLFVVGLLFGGCVLATGRLGPSIVAHAAFNAAGLVVAFRS